jgi:hypothetical protein
MVSNHNNDAKRDVRTHPFPWRIAFVAIGMLFIIVGAIVVTDLLEYNLRKSDNEVRKSENELRKTENELRRSQLSQNANIQQPDITSPVSASSVTTTGPYNDPSKVFESYGRLITLLVALLSALGVFFGYFVRRSIRDTEEDMDNRLTKNMDAWKEERKGIEQRYQDQINAWESKLIGVEELKTRLEGLQAEYSKSLEELKTDIKNLEIEYNQSIKEYKEAITQYKTEPQRSGPDIKEAAKDLDSQIAEPENHDE